MNFKKNIFLYTFTPLLLLVAAIGLYRFMIVHDYSVSYQIDCDPETSRCFVECVDEECVEKDYYAVVERSAPEILDLCGKNVSGCEAANHCPKKSESCSITFCDIGDATTSCDEVNI